jgi:hypothetical protein
MELERSGLSMMRPPGGASYGVSFDSRPIDAALRLLSFPLSFTAFVGLSRARGAPSFLRLPLRPSTDRPVSPLCRAASHAGAALRLVAAVDDSV